MNPRAILSPMTVATFALALLVGAAGDARAQVSEGVGPPSAEAIAKQAAEAAKKDEKPKRFPDFNEVIKDMKPTEGLFTLYRYDPADKERDTEKILCKIPKALLDEDLLFATSISRGGPLTGYMWTDYLVRWRIVGKHLKMITPESRYVTNKDKPVTDVVERTYTERFIAAVPIVTITPGGDPVIDLGELLKSNLADIQFMGGNVRPELSEWKVVKSFPENLLIDVDVALAQGQTGRAVGVAYAFRRLPKPGAYKPRVADDRVGYFLTVRKDWSKDPHERELFDRYVNRWQLEKRDPSLDLSPPKQPITFIIEKTVPIQWRRWVRQGIEDWNKAFEKIGFVDALVVHQQTDDNEFADYDPEDARYNFFRWIVTGRGFAMGPSRVDPRSGQILDADIIMDDSFVRAYMFSFDLYAPSGAAEFKGPAFVQWQQEHPELVPPLLRQAAAEPADEDALLQTLVEQKLRDSGHQVCAYARGMQQQLALVQLALLATGSGDKKISERFIGEAIREVVTHEVGHTLGLRHNFKASSWLSMDEIRERRNTTDEPTCASVMDYNPLLFFGEDKPETVRHFVTPTIGPYDEWAIEYGYRVADKGLSDEKMLQEIASRCTQRELAYATDEDTLWIFSPDPLVNRFDYASDPAGWAASRIELCDKLLKDVADWAVQDGEPRYYVRRAFDNLMFEKARNFEFVARLVGGQYYNRFHKGDPDAPPPFVLVDADAQRQALELLKKTVFSKDFFPTSPDLLNSLAVSRWSHWDARTPTRLDYPIHGRIAMLQVFTLLDLTAPAVLERVYDAELKSDDPHKLTAAELIISVRDHLWSELDAAGKGPYTDAKPFIDSVARNLQRYHLFIMLNEILALPGVTMPPDLQSTIRLAMKELSDKIGGLLAGKTKLDFASRAHLSECKSRIDRVLEAQFSAQ